MVIIEESKKDDKVDADGDGTPDTEQIGNREFVKRKTKLVLAKINPERVNDAIASIYKGMFVAILTLHYCLPKITNPEHMHYSSYIAQ